MIRARIRVDGRLAAVCRRFWGRRWRPTVACGERDGGIRHGERRSRTGMARVGGDVQLAGWAGQWQTGAVRPEMAGLAIERGRD